MPVRRPFLDEQNIPEFLLSNYGIKADRVTKIDRGIMSASYKISAGDELYFLKEPLNAASRNSIENELRVLSVLRSCSIPVAEFVQTLEGAWYVDHEDNFAALQKFIDGDEYSASDAPDSLYLPSMEMLGRINASLKDHRLKTRSGWGKKYCKDYDEQTVVQTLQDSLSQIESINLDDAEMGQAKKVINYLIKIQPQMKRYGHYQKYVTYSSTHGDYHVENLIYREGEILAVVDCASSCRMAVSYNLLRFHLKFGSGGARARVTNMPRLAEGLQRYTIHAPLTYYDYRFMPYVYLHILGRILLPFRIRRYIGHKATGNDELASRKLRGALRLIRLHKCLSDSADKISKYLGKCYENSLSREELRQHKQFIKQFEKQEDMKQLKKQERIARVRRIARSLIPLAFRKLGRKILPRKLVGLLDS